MKTQALVFVLSILLIMLYLNPAAAGVPCPPTSTVEATGTGSSAPNTMMCPGGDADHIALNIIVRDCYAVPMEGYMVVVSPVVVEGAIYMCPGEESKTVGPTDVNGWTEADFTAFGGCGIIQFSVTVNTVEVGPSNAIAVRSPDMNGDGLVSLVDFGWFATDYLGSDPCSDYNYDGNVDLVDFGHFAVHFMHGCL